MASAMDYNNYLSDRAKENYPDGIRGLFPLEKPGVVSFLAGKPNPSTFPFSSISLHIKPPFELESDVPFSTAGFANGHAHEDARETVTENGGKVKGDGKGGVTLELEGKDLDEALQYGPTAGLPRLVTLLTEFASKIHNRPVPSSSNATPAPVAQKPSVNGNASPSSSSAAPSRPDTPFHPTQDQRRTLELELKNTATGEPTREEVNDTAGVEGEQTAAHEIPWRVTVGGGCQDLLFKAFAVLLNPGDSLLVEAPVYAGVLSQWLMLGIQPVEVSVDHHGLSDVALRETLENWPSDKKFPKVLYTVPVGSNPTGTSSPEDRKLAILELCKKYGILILEDDPYYFLAQETMPSYFALETRVMPAGGHVVRFDSCSKVLSSGLRMGWATGPTPILKAMDVYTSQANLQPNGLAMGVMYQLLRHWGISGFVEHGRRVAQFYAQRRDKFEAIAHKHLDGLATWNSPVAGMFLWIDISPLKDSHDLVTNEAVKKGVLAVPGFAFYPSGKVSPHLRVSFSLVDIENDAERGFMLLAEAIREKRAAMGI